MRRTNGMLPTTLSSAWASALATAASAAIGCREKAPPPRPPTTQIITERALPATAQPTLIKQGNAPLVYLAESDATLRFVDITADSNELARALVKPRQIVRIDARQGVMLGETVLRAGPLPADHTYGIWLEPDPRNYSRDTIIKQMPPTQTPQTQQPNPSWQR